MAPVSNDGPDPTDPRPTVIFLHIGKTAGLTLRRILRRQFRRAEILEFRSPLTDSARLRREGGVAYFAALPHADRERARLIMGHTTFGVHEAVPRPSTYITMLREPVALNISLYQFILRRPKHVLYERAGEHVTLDSFVRSGLSLETDNSQTRALAGDTSTEFGGCTDAMLELAKSNVERRFAVAGLTERFDESLLLLRKAFGWSRLYYVSENVAPGGVGHPGRDRLPEETRRLIEEQNRFDVELYRWAVRRFEEAIDSHPSFTQELRDFRLGNQRYQPWGRLTFTYPKLVYDRFLRR